MKQNLLMYVKMYFVLRGAEFKKRLANPFDFFIYIFCDVAIQAIGIVFIATLFKNIPTVKGWDINNILLLYAFFQLSYGLFSCLFWPLYDFGYVLISGEFDKVLMRPLSSLFQLLCRDIGDIGGIVTGSSILGYLIIHGSLSLSIAHFLIMFVLLICNVILYVCIFTLIASTSFWLENTSNSLISILDISSAYARYPFPIFPKFIKIFLTWIIPLGFMGYYPVAYFINVEDHNIIFFLPLVLIGFVILTSKVWSLGLKKYRGVGN